MSMCEGTQCDVKGSQCGMRGGGGTQCGVKRGVVMLVLLFYQKLLTVSLNTVHQLRSMLTTLSVSTGSFRSRVWTEHLLSVTITCGG